MKHQSDPLASWSARVVVQQLFNNPIHVAPVLKSSISSASSLPSYSYSPLLCCVCLNLALLVELPSWLSGSGSVRASIWRAAAVLSPFRVRCFPLAPTTSIHWLLVPLPLCNSLSLSATPLPMTLANGGPISQSPSCQLDASDSCLRDPVVAVRR